MKVYSIGRGQDCDIVIADNSDVVSRHHATLTIFPSGKMCITDQSTNGTFVNGIKITPNVGVPVTRKDSVSFAHVSKLDWKAVPNFTPVWVWVIVGLVAAVILYFVGSAVSNHVKNSGQNPPVIENNVPPKDSSCVAKDTLDVAKDTTGVKDTVNVDKQKDNKADKKSKAVKKKAAVKEEKEVKEEPESKEEDKDTQSRRAIG